MEDPPFTGGTTVERHCCEAELNRRLDYTLEDLLDATKYPAVRIGAAGMVAEIGMHQHDAETILPKLEEIEVAQRQNGRR